MSQDRTTINPALLAKAPTPATVTVHSTADIQAAKAFGRVADDGTVFVKDGDTEREVGQFASADEKEALTFYARRYAELKGKIDLVRSRLNAGTLQPREMDEAVTSLRDEVKEPAVVGDIPALRQAVEELASLADAAKKALAQAREEAREQSIAARTAIAEEAEKLAASITKRTNWHDMGEQFQKLFEQWKATQRQTARLDQKTSDALWERFAAARRTFNHERSAWIDSREQARAASRAVKQALVKKAQELQNSTQWRETADKYAEIMAEWKKAGNAGREAEDALWTQLRAAVDTFYAARNASRDEFFGTLHANLEAKEALVARAEALLPVADVAAAKSARAALNAIQDEWDTIGDVPFADADRIEARMDAVDKQIKAVEDSEWSQSDPEADARKSSFTLQLEAQLAELDEKIAAAQAAGSDAEAARLQAERDAKAQWLDAVK
ncbi:DUF349 domain-containing protein [Alloscardovia macacae]|uniref:DNA repair protein n=1 Tax=Alloscardovia macacae TaxID=1160091 RepID=A0A261F5H7_9BIFI|nr:DUF349 domain-containing protein [Alloscardovia macacae]OZG54354.1 DNA repair protein [Alloscardovia macacae]